MSIGTLNEQPLHAALKAWYARDGDACEVPLDGYVIDIIRGDLLIEIQTGHFTAIRSKLRALLAAGHAVRLVYPVAVEKWIVRLDPADPDHGTPLSRRKSPKRGAVVDVFAELVHLPALLDEAAFSLDVLLVQAEELRRRDPNPRRGGRRHRRRGGWVIRERRLLDVIESHPFETPAGLAALLPDDLPESFTTADLAAGIGRPRRLAQQMAYCLRALDVIAVVGKRGNAVLYRRNDDLLPGITSS
ncbi:MAG: hypothetical protein JXQ72_04715 [Anaerolineae bacterium]|nr:hypothetical protein [Anaerolineae bacterium]